MDQRTRIIDAGLRHFAVHGYRRTTLDGVAAELGLGKTALYYYFKNKQDLFKAVVEREGDAVLGELEAVVRAQKDPWQKLRSFCLVRIRVTQEKVDVFRVSERVHKEVMEMVHTLEVSYFDREAELLKGILRQGIRAGEFRKINVARLVPLIQQVFQRMDVPFAYFRGRRETEKKVDFALDILFNGLKLCP